MAATRKSQPKDGAEVLRASHPQLGRFAIGFVLCALLALAIVPTVVGWNIDRRHQEVVEPTRSARGWLTEAHVGLALARAALNDFLSTHDSAHLALYQESRARERHAYDELRTLLLRLDRRVNQDFNRLERWSDLWHAGVDERLHDPNAVRFMLVEDENYQQTLVSAALLDHTITQTARAGEQHIETGERIARIITYIFVVIGVVAVLVVVAIGQNLRRIAGELAAGRAQLARVLETKARMMRGMAHDVKNPLGAIQGYAELLASGIKGELNEEQKQCARRIQGSVDSAVRVIDSLLDYARIETGALTLRPRRVAPAQLGEKIAAVYRGGFEAKRIGFTTRIVPPLPDIYTDPERVTQVVGNLLSNACKYTPSGGRVTMSIVPAERVDEHNETGVAIRVADTGPGIDPEHQEHVFDEFIRVPNDQGASGAGLGLAISRRLARLLGGDINVESAVGRGSVFQLWLPPQLPPQSHERDLAVRADAGGDHQMNGGTK